MSWSIYSSGAKGEVLASVKSQLASQSKCGEPEETLRVAGMALAVQAIEAQPDDVASVNVQCNGSAYTVDGVQVCNSIQIAVSAVNKS